MNIRHKAILVFLIILSGWSVRSLHAQQATDTLSLAKSLREKGELKKAGSVLEQYLKNHPNDLNGKWLLAQTYFWEKRFKKAKQLYNEAISLDPTLKMVQLDFAKSLVEMGETAEAAVLLENYTASDPGNAEAWYLRARITWWEGKSKLAQKMLDNIIRNVPNYKPALMLREEIRNTRLPWIRLNTQYRTDDQPLPFIQADLEGGKSITNLVNPDFSLYFPTAIPGDNLNSYQGLKLGNTMLVNHGKTSIYLNAGLIRHPGTLGTDWTTAVIVKQKLAKYWTIQAEVLRNPYLSTLGSLDIRLAEDHAGFSLAFDKPASWNGKISGGISRFSSDNQQVKSLSGWIFAPELRIRKFRAGIGAGFNWSDADTNLYVSDKSVADYFKGNSQNSNKKITASYNPYFTPENQQVISVLLNLHYPVSKKLSLDAKLNYGVLASSDYPYLYPDVIGADTLFVTAFVNKSFNPLETTLQANLKINEDLGLTFRYTYSETIFYASHYAGITLSKRIRYGK